MLQAGATIPGLARVWRAPGEDALALADALDARSSLLCFYPFDWSPT